MNYSSRQIGRTMNIMVLTILAVIFLIVLCFTEFDYIAIGILITSCFGFGVILLLFYALFIEVTVEKIKLKFGVGWIKKSIDIESIESVECVVNKWWYGFGIRLTPHGWLWNISGLDAVEIKRKNVIGAFRIGCKDSAKLKQEIEKRMNTE